MFNDIPSFKNKHARISNYHDELTKCIHGNVMKLVEDCINNVELCQKFEDLEKLIHASSANTGTVAWYVFNLSLAATIPRIRWFKAIESHTMLLTKGDHILTVSFDSYSNSPIIFAGDRRATLTAT